MIVNYDLKKKIRYQYLIYIYIYIYICLLDKGKILKIK